MPERATMVQAGCTSKYRGTHRQKSSELNVKPRRPILNEQIIGTRTTPARVHCVFAFATSRSRLRMQVASTHFHHVATHRAKDTRRIDTAGGASRAIAARRRTHAPRTAAGSQTRNSDE